MRTISTVEFVRSIKAGRVKSVLPMIAQKARETYHKLPDSEKMVRSLSDLIQEGVNHTVTHVALKFDPKQGVKFTTYLFAALDNYYADIIRKVYADKRLIPHGMLSADTTKVSVAGKQISILDKLKLSRKTRGDMEMNIINRIDGERAFLKAYANASPQLRRYLIRWLLQPRVGRFKPGTEFNSAKREFRKVARPILSVEMCETIQNDFLCRATIADKVASSFRTAKKKSNDYIFSEEYALAPILSQERIEKLIPVVF